ncbi:hypothetical protein GOODEAATRI_025820 [Goodea atripinnis]|uniref:Secreted protein n=1 Tax=Goodea atripinnis TaxID=208336 RepID=A0ABV0Q1T1_9TELE
MCKVCTSCVPAVDCADILAGSCSRLASGCGRESKTESVHVPSLHFTFRLRGDAHVDRKTTAKSAMGRVCGDSRCSGPDSSVSQLALVPLGDRKNLQCSRNENPLQSW